MKIAIMQPYYYPYAGYFRLFAATDLFVILDDVQWNRRGRVHRCESDGEWIHTLPIKRTDRDTTMIKDIRWQDGKEKPISPFDLITGGLREQCLRLGLKYKTIRSSSMGINPMLKGQDRIIAICKKLGATEYVNSPGGRELYDEAAFAKEAIKLTFLPEWRGSYKCIVERLAHESSDDVRRDIYAQI